MAASFQLAEAPITGDGMVGRGLWRVEFRQVENLPPRRKTGRGRKSAEPGVSHFVAASFQLAEAPITGDGMVGRGLWGVEFRQVENLPPRRKTGRGRKFAEPGVSHFVAASFQLAEPPITGDGMVGRGLWRVEFRQVENLPPRKTIEISRVFRGLIKHNSYYRTLLVDALEPGPMRQGPIIALMFN